MPPHKRPTNIVFQRGALFPHMNVAENIGYSLKIRGWPKDRIATRVEEMLALVRLEGLGHRGPDRAEGRPDPASGAGPSAGPGTEVLLLDEPLSALDLKLRQHMQLELRAIQRKLERDLRLRHARPDRGDRDVGPYRGHEPGPHRAGGYAREIYTRPARYSRPTSSARPTSSWTVAPIDDDRRVTLGRCRMAPASGATGGARWPAATVPPCRCDRNPSAWRNCARPHPGAAARSQRRSWARCARSSTWAAACASRPPSMSASTIVWCRPARRGSRGSRADDTVRSTVARWSRASGPVHGDRRRDECAPRHDGGRTTPMTDRTTPGPSGPACPARLRADDGRRSARSSRTAPSRSPGTGHRGRRPDAEVAARYSAARTIDAHGAPVHPGLIERTCTPPSRPTEASCPTSSPRTRPSTPSSAVFYNTVNDEEEDFAVCSRPWR